MVLAEEFTRYRPYLFAVAYHILGEVQEAEDVLQDVVTACLEAPTKPIQHPKAYLTRMVANQSIDRLKVLKKQRAVYTGTWLPEPLITPERSDGIASEGILSYEVLHALENLTPTERAVFVLREAFDYPYREMASWLNTTEANCRQLLRRARQKIAVRPTAPAPSSGLETLMRAFLHACQEQNLEALLQLLHEDVAMYSDGGGKVSAAVHPVLGRRSVGKFFLGLARKGLATIPVVVDVNGQTGFLYTAADGTPATLVLVALEHHAVKRFFIVRNPDKLKILLQSVTK
ncbi:RNA polymerase sigma-70 factor, ECF subfamily [Catalinimonas alkaloidigena]|uniref:RNA polymerase sigma-70 factor, ECF subfamily n=1 Tax=Catalinimonas alkaloidigena TaxID=1075417 RepID=A0A1G9E6K4_9BACT|nr:sigma-70 family RNA polymerase sigma factor [Catalinimonas alkaloidigena]SDK71708.1 RNA polymerase sigma-70 factor, ECF subfamily [Catalinimonas alkaloidigena]